MFLQKNLFRRPNHHSILCCYRSSIRTLVLFTYEKVKPAFYLLRCPWIHNCMNYMREKYHVFRQKEQDLLNMIGVMYSSCIFLGGANANIVQPVVAIERIVLYRERSAGMYSELPYAIGQVKTAKPFT